MIGWHCHQLGYMQIIYTLFQPARHHSFFYRPDALPYAQPAVSKPEG